MKNQPMNQSMNQQPAQAMQNSAGTKASAGMNNFKYEVANELGVPLKEGYNGNLTSAQAGSIGGEMVRQMIQNQEDLMNGSNQQ